MPHPILFLDKDLKTSTTFLNDKHIRRMPITILQALSYFLKQRTLFNGGYSIYGEAVNYNTWLEKEPFIYFHFLMYFEALTTEYQFRFDKPHPSLSLLKEFKEENLLKNIIFHYNGGVSFPIRVDIKYHCIEGASLSIEQTHKAYYKDVYSNSYYTSRIRPRWLNKEEENDVPESEVYVDSF